MPLVLVGVFLLVLKLAEFGPFASMSWWIVAAPFAAAVAWWQFADATGWTQRRAMDKMERRKEERRERALEALGLDHKREREVRRVRDDAGQRSVVDPTQVPPPPPSPPADPVRREPRL